MDSGGGSGGWDGPPGLPVLHSHLAYFVVPLPEPLGLPDKHREVFLTPTSDEHYKQHEDEGWPLPPSEHLTVSLVFHHAQTESGAVGLSGSLFELAREIFPDSENELVKGGMAEKVRQVAACTFVEMAIAVDVEGADDPELSEAFDAGLRCVREVQRAYYLLRRGPIHLATRETMPFVVPSGIRRLFDDEGEPAEFRVPLSMFALHTNVRREARDEELDSTELQGLAQASHQLEHPGFATDYLEFLRETSVALHSDGSYRAAVLFAATACEVLLDNLLAHMLWEEKLRPEEAARIFDPTRSVISARVKKMYHGRLGGQWSLDLPGPIHEWFADVAQLRNRVVHGGYEPTFYEASNAADTAFALSIHLGDLVAAKSKEYPRTAFVLPGKDGVRRRGKWGSHLETVLDGPHEVNWVETYSRWRAAMHRAAVDSSTFVAPMTGRATVYAVVEADKTVKWLIRDEVAGMAAEVEPSRVANLSAAQADALDRISSHLTSTGGTGRNLVTSFGVAVAETASEDWVPEYRLIPMTGVMVTGEDLA